MFEKREKSVVLVEMEKVVLVMQSVIAGMDTNSDESYGKGLKNMDCLIKDLVDLRKELGAEGEVEAGTASSGSGFFKSIFETATSHPVMKDFAEKVDDAVGSLSGFVGDIGDKIKNFSEEESPVAGSLLMSEAFGLRIWHELLSVKKSKEESFEIIVNLTDKMMSCKSTDIEAFDASFKKLKKAGFDEDIAFKIIQEVTRVKGEKKAE